ncbi:MAG: helix-turn-helix transcriptional regulator, partial [Flavobacteriaceae bacterium]|nr:helix-turn-helix transcriptional regulator [Flavobacteriaceae bacterium]
ELVNEKGGELAEKFGEHTYFSPYIGNEASSYRKTVYILLIIAIIGFLALVFGSRYYAHKKEQRLHSLTPRELEVFKYAQNGKTNKEIASLLNVESSTIKSHIKNIYKKLQISSRRDLAGFNF